MKTNSCIEEYDSVIDLVTKKTGTVVYITDGNFQKDIPKEYLFEPDDHTFEPVFRKYDELKPIRQD